MNELNHYLNELVSDLPMSEDEKAELKEELSLHLNEHVKELMIKGHTEEEAIVLAMKSFGNQSKLNREMKRVMFPFYKVIRYLWNVLFVIGFLCLTSYAATEYFHPGMDFSLDAESVGTALVLIILFSGIAELAYEAVIGEYKSKWIRNPWVFFMVPSLFIGALMSISLILHPERYPEGLWLDLFTIPIGAFVYLIARQLFTLVFIGNGKGPKTQKTN